MKQNKIKYVEYLYEERGEINSHITVTGYNILVEKLNDIIEVLNNLNETDEKE